MGFVIFVSIGVVLFGCIAYGLAKLIPYLTDEFKS